VSWQQWYDTLKETIVKTKETYDDVYLIGLSMGACLSIYGAAKGLPVKGVVSLAAPIYLRDRRACFAPVLKYFMPFISKNGLFKKKRRKVHEQTNLKYKRVAYDYQSLNGVNNLLKLIKNVKLELKNLKVSIMVVQSEDDSAVLNKSAQYIYDMAGSEKKHILYLKKSGHIVTMGEENALMFEEIYKFLRGI
jgi:carboxylesterase